MEKINYQKVKDKVCLFFGVPIKLGDSKIFLRWPNETINEKNLVRLLEEAYSRGVSGKNKVLVNNKVRNPKLNWKEINDPQDEDYVNIPVKMRYQELNEFYKKLNWSYGYYSPENEEKRINALIVCYEKQVEFPFVMGRFMHEFGKSFFVI